MGLSDGAISPHLDVNPGASRCETGWPSHTVFYPVMTVQINRPPLLEAGQPPPCRMSQAAMMGALQNSDNAEKKEELSSPYLDQTR